MCELGKAECPAKGAVCEGSVRRSGKREEPEEEREKRERTGGGEEERERDERGEDGEKAEKSGGRTENYSLGNYRSL